MPVFHVHLSTRWRIGGRPAEIYDVIADADALSRWWPAVHLEARLLERGAPDGTGLTVEARSRGWLPLTQRWRYRVTEAARPARLAVAVGGDLEGTAVWTLSQTAADGPYVDVRFELTVRPRRPLAGALWLLLRPLVVANLRWAMARGELSLLIELRRRRAVTGHERDMVPLPPGPPLAPSRRALVGPGYPEPRPGT